METFVFLDTNRLVDDWLLQKPSAQAFLTGLKQVGFRFRVPAIVIDETVNKFREELGGTLEEGSKELQRTESLTGKSLSNPYTQVDIESETERYRERLEARITGTSHGEISKYPSTPHKEIAQCAIEGEALFASSAGYRDTLVWESIKRELHPNARAFIISSDHAFFNSTSSLPDYLSEDIENESLDVVVEPFRTIRKFNDAHLNEELERLENVQKRLERGEGRAGRLKRELQKEVRYRLASFDLNRERGIPDSWVNIEQKEIRDVEMLEIEQVRQLDHSSLLLDCRFRVEPLVRFAKETRDEKRTHRLKDHSEIVHLKLDVSATLDPDSLDLKSLEVGHIEVFPAPSRPR